MVYLWKKAFLPEIILMCFIGLPFLITLIVCCVLAWRIEIFAITIGLFVVLLSIILILFYETHHFFKTEYLIAKQDCLEIYGRSDYGDPQTKCWTIPYEKILGFKYYSIFSIRGWFNYLFDKVPPRCVYIIVEDLNNEKPIFIGYLSLKQLKMIAKDKKIVFR